MQMTFPAFEHVQQLSRWLPLLIRVCFGVIFPDLLPYRSLLFLFAQHGGDIYVTLLHQVGIIPLAVDSRA